MRQAAAFEPLVPVSWETSRSLVLGHRPELDLHDLEHAELSISSPSAWGSARGSLPFELVSGPPELITCSLNKGRLQESTDNGAAQESNLPTLGLPDLTGFEGLPARSKCVRKRGFRPASLQLDRGSAETGTESGTEFPLLPSSAPSVRSLGQVDRSHAALADRPLDAEAGEDGAGRHLGAHGSPVVCDRRSPLSTAGHAGERRSGSTDIVSGGSSGDTVSAPK
jgi:hypothetical protein